MIHATSFGKPAPGSGQKETTSDVAKYNTLMSLAKTNKDWRRALDDDYIHSIVVDGKKWSSVRHFILGSQFKKKNEDLYNEFSLDGNENSKVALQIDQAVKFSNEHRKKIDSDFKSITSTRKEEAREKAIHRKFGESAMMKNLLVSTYPAKIIKFRRGKEPIDDILLMKTRKMFSMSKN